MANTADPSELSDGERGWALVSVLWVVTGLSLLAASTELLSANSYRLERETLRRAQAEAALDAGVARAVLGIEAPSPSDRWKVDGSPQTFPFSGMALTVTVQDELGRFDLNAIDGSMLVNLFRFQGASEEDAETLSDRVQDWRSASAGDLRRLHGATDHDYLAAGLRYRPRHGAFQSVDELRLVLGMTPELFSRVRPALTAYTKKPMIDTAVATREALLTLYRGDTATVDNLLHERESANGTAVRPDSALSFPGRTFTISVQTDLASHHYTRTAVVLLTADEKRPYLVLAWQ